MKSPVRIAVTGAGNRARKYTQYILSHPGDAILIPAADPDSRRRERFAAETSLEASRLYATDEEMLAERADEIDAVIIASPDRHHYRQAMRALRHGCHILVEKPVACSSSEVADIAREATDRRLVAGVCHVLRYHPYFQTLHSLIAEGSLGTPVAIHHRISVGLDRALHTFIRGPWADSRMTSPPILSKCCHDADLLLWLTGATGATAINTMASPLFILRNDRPATASDRCIDCNAESDCPFSAVDLYSRRGLWTDNFDPQPDETHRQTIDRYLRHSRFGRCAYICDTDAPLSQSINLTTDTGCLATLTLDMIGDSGRRSTHIVLTRGEIHGDELTLTHQRFGNRQPVTTQFTPGPYHSGADHALVSDFITAIRNPTHRMKATIAEAQASTEICLKAYEAIMSHKIIICQVHNPPSGIHLR